MAGLSYAVVDDIYSANCPTFNPNVPSLFFVTLLSHCIVLFIVNKIVQAAIYLQI